MLLQIVEASKELFMWFISLFTVLKVNWENCLIFNSFKKSSVKSITCWHNFSERELFFKQFSEGVALFYIFANLCNVWCIKSHLLLTAASAFSLLWYHTSHRLWKLHYTLMREQKWKKPNNILILWKWFWPSGE